MEAPYVGPAPVPPAVPSWMAPPPVEHPSPVAIEPPAAPEPIEPWMPVVPVQATSRPRSIAGPPLPRRDEPTVRISWGRVAAELPVEAFNVPLDQVAERMRQPGALLIPQSLVLPQLAEGLIRVGWDVIAPQFPREAMAVSDAEMAERLPNGIRLPLDEIVRQVPLDLFMAAGPAADVRGLEYFPAPFQPLVSDPAPEAPVGSGHSRAARIETVVAEESREAVLEPAPALVLAHGTRAQRGRRSGGRPRAGSDRGASGRPDGRGGSSTRSRHARRVRRA